MNKLIILLLAVCISVNAFVKRDAPEPAAAPNPIQDLAKQLQQFQEDLGQKVAQSLNPEEFKKGVDNLLANITTAINELKGKSDSPK